MSEDFPTKCTELSHEYINSKWESAIYNFCHRFRVDNELTLEGSRYFSGYIDRAKLDELVLRENENSEKRINILLAICAAAFERIDNLEIQVASLNSLNRELIDMRAEIEELRVSSDFK